MMELRVAVAGGVPLIRAGIVAAMALDDRLRLVDQDVDVEHAGDLLRRKACDVLVLNTESPHTEVGAVLNGSAGDPQRPKVLVLTDVESQRELLGTLQKGVEGYGIRSCLLEDDIRSGILAVGRGLTWTCPLTTRSLVQLAVDDAADAAVAAARAGRQGPLSVREVEVLRCAASGEGEEQIAKTLYLSRNTVKTYLRRIREKLHVTTRGEAVLRGYERGLIPVPVGTSMQLNGVVPHSNGVA
jgi:DNA-binding NarL/FixJ family response regulator